MKRTVERVKKQVDDAQKAQTDAMAAMCRDAAAAGDYRIFLGPTALPQCKDPQYKAPFCASTKGYKGYESLLGANDPKALSDVTSYCGTSADAILKDLCSRATAEKEYRFSRAAAPPKPRPSPRRNAPPAVHRGASEQRPGILRHVRGEAPQVTTGPCPPAGMPWNHPSSSKTRRGSLAPRAREEPASSCPSCAQCPSAGSAAAASAAHTAAIGLEAARRAVGRGRRGRRRRSRPMPLFRRRRPLSAGRAELSRRAGRNAPLGARAGCAARAGVARQDHDGARPARRAFRSRRPRGDQLEGRA
jgi:hypothetical protein